jgi:hypothetical protein
MTVGGAVWACSEDTDRGRATTVGTATQLGPGQRAPCPDVR